MREKLIEISSVNSAFEPVREGEKGEGEARKRRTPIQKDEQMRTPPRFSPLTKNGKAIGVVLVQLRTPQKKFEKKEER